MPVFFVLADTASPFQIAGEPADAVGVVPESVYLIGMGSGLKRKITALLDQVFPEFASQFSTSFGKTAIAVLRQHPTPEKLSRAQAGKLTEVLQTASNGRFGEWKARQLKELARDSFGIPGCGGYLLHAAPAVPEAVSVSPECSCRIGEKDCGTVLPV